MSWHVHYASKADFESDTRTFSSTAEHIAPDALAVARAAAGAIIASRAVGDPRGDFMVTLSGHANPGHVPAPGYANDVIAVSVTQKSGYIVTGE